MRAGKPDTPDYVHASIDLPPEPRAAGTARHFVLERLAGEVGEDVAETAMLLTSELVTNAIVHARTPMRLDVERTGDAIRVGVVDGAPRSPAVRRAHEARLTGRGMNLVCALAERWGVEPVPPGKKVWFELPA